VERIAGRIAQQLRPEEGSSGSTTDHADLAEQVRLVAARHASEMSEQDASAFGAKVRDTAAPISLTSGQNS
jgi:hypothetical protein